MMILTISADESARHSPVSSPLLLHVMSYVTRLAGLHEASKEDKLKLLLSSTSLAIAFINDHVTTQQRGHQNCLQLPPPRNIPQRPLVGSYHYLRHVNVLDILVTYVFPSSPRKIMSAVAHQSLRGNQPINTSRADHA